MTGSNDEKDIVYYETPTNEIRDVLAKEVHPDDQAMVREGASADVVKGLRLRREKHFANEIEGPVHSGSLSKWKVFAYAPASMTTVPLTVLISVYVIQFYEKVGATLGLLAFFQGLARAFDVITDPTMSYLTDSCRSKYGRRRPFLATGAPFYGVALFCLMCPWPSLSETGVSIWFGIFYIIFFLFATYCNIPYDALGPELTDNQKDRNLVFFTCTMFDGAGGLFAAILPAGLGQTFTWYRRTSNADRYDSCNNLGEGGTVNALGAVGPWIGGLSSAPKAIAQWSGIMSNSSLAYGWSGDECAPLAALANGNSTTAAAYNPDLVTWCECIAKANQVHNLDSLRYSYATVGLFFGGWAIISLLVCVYSIKERSQLSGAKVLSAPKPLVPSILNTFQNRPFTLLMPAWTFDSLANALIVSLLTFFVRYVVQPEYSNQERWGCAPVMAEPKFLCTSDGVLAFSVLAFLFGVVIFTPMWLFLSKRYGKRTTWLLWSLTNGVTFLFYAFVGPGDVYLCIVMSVFNGAPTGAKFLADSVMADVIDYDEYLTGTRAEATYTMFKGFLPKIAAIPASALPIALLGSFGHIPVINGISQRQPESVLIFIKIAIIYIPALLSFLSFLIKLRYPLRTDRHNELITEGIAKHLLLQEAEDACSGNMYMPVHFTDEEIASVDMIDSFPGVQVATDLLRDPVATAQRLVLRMWVFTALACVWLIGFAVTSFATFDLLSGSRSYIPVLAVVGFGLGITILAFSILRLITARALVTHLPTHTTLMKVLRQREELDELRTFDSSIMGGCRRDQSLGALKTASQVKDDENDVVELT